MSIRIKQFIKYFLFVAVADEKYLCLQGLWLFLLSENIGK